ncbi:MAG: IclR family transcriptional regulator [Salinigranum sp.]
MAEPEITQVQSVTRLMQLLEELSARNGAGVTELGEATDLAKSTVHRYLATLYDLNYVVKDDGKYYLSVRFADIGESSRNRRTAYGMAAHKVEELATETNERCQFVVEEHGRGVYVYVATGNKAVLTGSHVGKRLYLHATSVGKSILAHLPQSRVDEILDRWGLPRRTEQTITDREVLLAELERIREEGVAFNREGNVEGLRSVGAPVFDGNGEVIGGLSVSGPTHRLKGSWYEREIPDLLLGAANELELKIKYRDDQP